MSESFSIKSVSTAPRMRDKVRQICDEMKTKAQNGCVLVLLFRKAMTLSWMRTGSWNAAALFVAIRPDSSLA